MEGSARGDRIPLSPSSPMSCSPDVRYQVTGKMPRPVTSGSPRSANLAQFSPGVKRPLSTQLPSLPISRDILKHYNFVRKTRAYSRPDIVSKIFTGTLPSSYFNDIAYGRRATPQEYVYKGLNNQREKELWEPKNVSREQARHVIRDIQDARFRKQNQLEKQSLQKERQRTRRTELTLLREAETMPRGLKAYLNKLHKVSEQFDAKSKLKRARQSNAVKNDPVRNSHSV